MIKVVEDAVQDMKYKSSSTSASTAPPLAPIDRPPITDAAAHWSLNPEQFAAFVPIACAVLDICLSRLRLNESSSSAVRAQAITEDELKRIHAASDKLRALIAASALNPGGSSAPNAHAESISQQTAAEAVDERKSMFMLITGSGGTGKSRVIHCVRDFARRWFMSNSLRVTATTGAAAANIQASTWQATVGDYYLRAINGVASEEARNVWSSVGLLIVDEISMAGAVSLLRLDQHLKSLKASNALFGGMHMVVLGDFWQLGAVRQSPVYGSKPTSKAKPSSMAANAAGHRIWRQLTNGVELVANMRAAQDKPFAAILEHFRVNQGITQDEVNTLNESCAITPNRQPPSGNQ